MARNLKPYFLKYSFEFRAIQVKFGYKFRAVLFFLLRHNVKYIYNYWNPILPKLREIWIERKKVRKSKPYFTKIHEILQRHKKQYKVQ